MRRLLLAAPVALLLVACTTDASDFKSQTEDFINDDSDVENLFDGADISGASCTSPDSTDVGTTYTCTAEAEGIGTIRFDAVIDKENSFSVTPAS